MSWTETVYERKTNEVMKMTTATKSRKSKNLSNKLIRHWEGRTVCTFYSHYPTFFKVVGFKGDKTVVLERIQQMYDSRYGSNSPHYHTLPLGTEYVPGAFPTQWYKVGNDVHEHVEATVRALDDGGSESLPLLVLYTRFERYIPWDGKPLQGWCD